MVFTNFANEMVKVGTISSTNARIYLKNIPPKLLCACIDSCSFPSAVGSMKKDRICQWIESTTWTRRRTRPRKFPVGLHIRVIFNTLI
jgi:hypothetical protein